MALSTCLYVGWIMPVKSIVDELAAGSELFAVDSMASKGFVFFLRFVCPLVIAAVLLNMLGVFGIFGGGG